jgi:hypothetical protein
MLAMLGAILARTAALLGLARTSTLLGLAAAFLRVAALGMTAAADGCSSGVKFS